MFEDNSVIEDGQKKVTIWSIGHSNVCFCKFEGLLRSANIQTVVDCRTRPRSRFRQFNQESIANGLAKSGINYEWRGSNLGGLGKNVFFDETLDEIVDRSSHGERIAIMCSEGKPEQCHRKSLIEPELVNRDAVMEHLLY